MARLSLKTANVPVGLAVRTTFALTIVKGDQGPGEPHRPNRSAIAARKPSSSTAPRSAARRPCCGGGPQP